MKISDDDNLLKDILGNDSEEESFPLEYERRPSKRRADEYWDDHRKDVEDYRRRHQIPPPPRSSHHYLEEQVYSSSRPRSPPPVYYPPSAPRYADGRRSRDYERLPRDSYDPYPYEEDNYRRYSAGHRNDGWYDNGVPKKQYEYQYQQYDEGSRSYHEEPRNYPREEFPRARSVEGHQKPPTKTIETSSIKSSLEEGEFKPKITPIVFDLNGSKETAKPVVEQRTNHTVMTAPRKSLKPENVRFFVARCNYYDMFVKSKWEGVWKAPSYIVTPIEAALSSCDQAWLIFSVHGSQYYQGIAQVDRSRPIEHPNAKSKLAKLPITWIIIADVPYFAFPNIPGIMSDGGLRETFEIPATFGKELLPIFEKHKEMDSTIKR